jgi:hypothetical protein
VQAVPEAPAEWAVPVEPVEPEGAEGLAVPEAGAAVEHYVTVLPRMAGVGAGQLFLNRCNFKRCRALRQQKGLIGEAGRFKSCVNRPKKGARA